MEICFTSLEKPFVSRSSFIPTTQSNVYIFEVIMVCQLGPKKERVYFQIM